MVGTGALFLVYELEKLVYRLGHAVRAPGLSDGSATEWHTKDLRLVIAFPIVAPILAIWNVLLLFWDGVSAAGRGDFCRCDPRLARCQGVCDLARRTAVTCLGMDQPLGTADRGRHCRRHRCAVAHGHPADCRRLAMVYRAVSAAWRWFAAGVALVWGSLVAAVTAAGRWLTGVLRTLWTWITRPIVAVWHWLVRAAARPGACWQQVLHWYGSRSYLPLPQHGNGSLRPSEHFGGRFSAVERIISSDWPHIERRLDLAGRRHQLRSG